MELILMGLGLGLAAGVSPGPLLTLVITSTLQRGFGAGLRIALAPVLTDAPIVALALLILHELPELALAAIGVLGGGVVTHLGIATLRRPISQRRGDASSGGDARDLWRGAVVNFLNPHPWIFWSTVQGPMLVRGWRQDPLTAVAFVAAFYLALVGSKIAVAGAVASGRRALSDRWYRRVVAGSGALLIAMGLILFCQSIGVAVRAGS